MPKKYKFSGEGRQQILAEIRTALRIDQTGQFAHIKPETLRVAEIVEVAEQLGIDPSRFGAVKGAASAPAKPAVAVSRPTPGLGVVVAEPVSEPVGPADIDPIQAQVDEILGSPVSAMADVVRGLVEAANKAPEIIEVPVPAQTVDAAVVAPQVSKVEVLTAQPDMDAGELFGLSDVAGPVKIFNSSQTPIRDSQYQWQKPVAMALKTLGGYHPLGKFVAWFHGPAGSGKTSAAAQFAAISGRPYFSLNFDGTMSRLDFVGGIAVRGGSTEWQDGLLTRAIRQPNAVIVLDELTRARQDDLVFLNQVLESDSRCLTIPETGERVRVADGVIFVICDNTNGTGDPFGRYIGTKVMDSSLLDRASIKCLINPPSTAVERQIIADKTGVSKSAAAKVVAMGQVCRKATAEGMAVNLSPSIRGLTSFVACVLNGYDANEAFEASIAGSLTPDDYEVAQGLFCEHVDPVRIAALIRREVVEGVEDEEPVEEEIVLGPVVETADDLPFDS